MSNKSLGRFIASIYRHQSILIQKRLDPYQVGCGQYVFLIRISENEGINHKDLSHLIRIDRANTTRAAKKLEEVGYIRSEQDPDDRRVQRLYLTEKGHNIMPIIRQELNAVTQIMSQGLSSDEQDLLVSMLETIETNVNLEVETLRKDYTHGK